MTIDELEAVWEQYGRLDCVPEIIAVLKAAKEIQRLREADAFGSNHFRDALNVQEEALRALEEKK